MACHPRATCHIAGCKNSIRLLKIVFRHILFFCLFNEFGLWRAATFVSSPIHLLIPLSQQNAGNTCTVGYGVARDTDTAGLDDSRRSLCISHRTKA